MSRREELAQKIWNDWQKGLEYQKKINLKETCEQCVDFYEGRQWPQATERTKNMPRPIENIIELIVNGKKANILSSKISVIYKPLIYNKQEAQIATEGASSFTSFAHHIAKEIKPIEEKIDNYERNFRENNILRLNEKICNANSSTIFLDLISNLERIGDHATNIAETVV